MTRLAGLLALAVLMGCESEASKLTRLRQEQTTSCLTADREYAVYQVVADRVRAGGLLNDMVDVRNVGDTAKANHLDSIFQSRTTRLGALAKGQKWQDAKAVCDLATRDVDRMLK